MVRTRGLTQVCRKLKSFHYRNAERTFRRLERRGIFTWDGRCHGISHWHPELLAQNLTGDSGGVGKVGVGSRVERADAPVSPLSSPLRLLLSLLDRTSW